MAKKLFTATLAVLAGAVGCALASGCADDEVNDTFARSTCVPGAQEPCYSGPADTEGVGMCRAGTRTCEADGLSWGPCEDEITPADETCLTPEDDDCDGEVNEDGEGCVCAPGDSEPCYTGPAGTEGVGECQGGTWTCEQGMQWGPCEGEVTPVQEICDNGIDEDCTGTSDDVYDVDGDGWTRCEGDCCETTADCPEPVKINPGAVELPTQPGDPTLDENCDGQFDEAPVPCDSNLALDSMDPMDGARAVGLCKQSTAANEWGVVNAQWTLPAGNSPAGMPNFDLGHGILSGFGPNVNVQEGSKMLALSSGTARQPTDPGYQDVAGFQKGISDTGHPYGFPKESPSCGSAVTGTCNDGVALELTLRAPPNVDGFSFDFIFYTYEWPDYVCSQFNDFFAALLDLDGTFSTLGPYPQGQYDGNITSDQLGNPMSVNNAFFEVCGCSGGPPCQAGGITFTCALGTSELDGTGFEGHAATSWLVTQAPIDPGSEFAIRWLAYDSGDDVLDSTGLVDNFQWLAGNITVGTTPKP